MGETVFDYNSPWWSVKNMLDYQPDTTPTGMPGGVTEISPVGRDTGAINPAVSNAMSMTDPTKIMLKDSPGAFTRFSRAMSQPKTQAAVNGLAGLVLSAGGVGKDTPVAAMQRNVGNMLAGKFEAGAYNAGGTMPTPTPQANAASRMSRIPRQMVVPGSPGSDGNTRVAADNYLKNVEQMYLNIMRGGAYGSTYK